MANRLLNLYFAFVRKFIYIVVNTSNAKYITVSSVLYGFRSNANMFFEEFVFLLEIFFLIAVGLNLKKAHDQTIDML